MALHTLDYEEALTTDQKPVIISIHMPRLHGIKEPCEAPECSGTASIDTWATRTVEGEKQREYLNLCAKCFSHRLHELFHVEEDERVVVPTGY